jgi:3-dehydroquinate dehydratase/shikimate dehydrogenase
MKPAKLCATVTATTMAELRTRRDQVGDADLVELRLDTVSDPSAAAALAGRRTAEYVDLEWNGTCADLIAQTGGRRIVLSHHDFEGTPADVNDKAQAMLSSGAEVVKLATTAHRLADCLTLRAIGQQTRVPMVLIAMGDAGLATRILASWFGSCWTYAGDSVAPGQVEVARMHQEFRFRRIGSRTAVYGVVGKPVTHSVSPSMHNAAFRAANLDAVYLPLAAADYGDFIAFAAALNLAGASVTAPFKVPAFEQADECDPVSRRIQSVNTLRRVGTKWLGCNTDVAGFLSPLESAMKPAGKRATILGAGGAARSVAVALGAAGAKVTISARRPEQAQAIAALTGARIGDWPPPAGSWDLLVNTTPVGTTPNHEHSPLPNGHPLDGDLVYDLIYNPPQTRLLRDAAAAGCRTIGGLDMLVAQAQAQFEWWTGGRPADRVMREAAMARLASQGTANAETRP